MRKLLLLVLFLCAPLAHAAERPVDTELLLFLGEFAELETGLQPEDLGYPASGIGWDALPVAEQQILAHSRGTWDDTAADQRWWLVLGATRWATLRGSQRRQMDDYLRDWQRLTEGQRERIRTNLRRFAALDESQRRAIRERYEDFSRLSPGQQRRLRDTFQSMGEYEREQLIQRLVEGAEGRADEDGG